MKDQDVAQQLQQQVVDAYQQRRTLRVVGSNSKAFYGNVCEGDELSVADHCGIIQYEPSELVVSARAGTKIAFLQALLAENKQMLAFEPPHLGPNATVGGVFAAGLSGSSRPFMGAVRDHILGCKILNGKGEILNFGGQVIKNVAGYDVSRLLVGSLGTLGVLLEVSIKVVPIPERSITLLMQAGVHEAIDIMNVRAGKPLPLTAASYDGESVLLRFAGVEAAIDDIHRKVAGDVMENDTAYWVQLREQTHYFFEEDAPLWRISLAPGSLPLGVPGNWLFDWGGALRWLKSYEPANHIRDAVHSEGGHATLFRRSRHQVNVDFSIFHPLPLPLLKYHQRLKAAFDPHRILNRHRLYEYL